jgi:uncharacterized protein
VTVSVRDLSSRSRYEVRDGDELAGYTEYKLNGDMVAFTHTGIDAAFAGRGLARQLVTQALADARARGLGVLPYCPFVRDVIAKNPQQYLDLVPARERARFDLPARGQVNRSESGRVTEAVEP